MNKRSYRVKTNTFDNFGILQNKTTSGNVQNLGYSFDPGTGNLMSRTDNIRSLTESFTYDHVNRLKSVGGPVALTMNYSASGNITSKTGPGVYTYGSLPHAVSQVTNPQGDITTDQAITYMGFNKTQGITEGNLNLQLTYDQNRQRTTSKLYQNGVLQKTVYYLDNYEKEVSGGNTRELHYIPAWDGIAAIFEVNNGVGSMYYVHTDHLGSFDVVTNSSGTPVENYSFDAWGRRRNPANWTYAGLPSSYLYSRGYTWHEHLDQFGLINMNGRMYDPLLGRTLSPDNYVQMPDFTQSYNRYSYVLNNPLKYTDPSGEKLKWWQWGLLDILTGGFLTATVPAMVTTEIAVTYATANLMYFINSFIDPQRSLNAGDIWLGLFKTDPNLSTEERILQFASRFTWEGLQNDLGYNYTQIRNLFGGVDRVDYFGGATFATRENRDGSSGMSLGSFINITISDEIEGDFTERVISDPLFMHEYGHTFDSKRLGLIYLFAVGLPSLISASSATQVKGEPTGVSTHDFRVYEMRANKYAAKYFGKYYGVDWELTIYKAGNPIETYYPRSKR